MKSSIKISNRGNTIRATGAAANALFNALTAEKPEVIGNATPRPWHLVPHIARVRAGTMELFVADCKIGGNGEANAALIVKAVNEHAALEAIAEAAKPLREFCIRAAARGDKLSSLDETMARQLVARCDSATANLEAVRKEGK